MVGERIKRYVLGQVVTHVTLGSAYEVGVGAGVVAGEFMQYRVENVLSRGPVGGAVSRKKCQ